MPSFPGNTNTPSPPPPGSARHRTTSSVSSTGSTHQRHISGTSSTSGHQRNVSSTSHHSDGGTMSRSTSGNLPRVGSHGNMSHSSSGGSIGASSNPSRSNIVPSGSTSNTGTPERTVVGNLTGILIAGIEGQDATPQQKAAHEKMLADQQKERAVKLAKHGQEHRKKLQGENSDKHHGKDGADDTPPRRKRGVRGC
ncbi:hypothetical protein AB5N19_05720 [Seiridium cardinale]|uniref:Uncharacterized protein n=1 Tax=Seiridium cardinale TaxID=138064 RepID=A0ABR2XJ90_9PEZI